MMRGRFCLLLLHIQREGRREEGTNRGGNKSETEGSNGRINGEFIKEKGRWMG